MKKILGLTVVALLIMGLVGGGTWAYFSDPESSTGNTFAAGTLDLEVDTENPWTSTAIDNSATPMKPGETFSPISIDCKNVGSLPGDLYMQITTVLGVGGDNMLPYTKASSEPEYEAEGGTYDALDAPNNDNTPVDTIDTVMTLSCEKGGSGITGLDGVKLDVAGGAGWKLVEASLAVDAIAKVDLGATLEDTATNEYQGDTVSFTIEFQLVQEGQSAS